MCWTMFLMPKQRILVSVAGCLGYDVLDYVSYAEAENISFSCWLLRLPRLRCTEIIKNKFWLGLCIVHTEFFIVRSIITQKLPFFKPRV